MLYINFTVIQSKLLVDIDEQKPVDKIYFRRKKIDKIMLRATPRRYLYISIIITYMYWKFIVQYCYQFSLP